MNYDVFISYSMKDKAVGDAVCATLESNGIRCWIAPRDIVPGQEWGEAIVNAIRGAKVMVLVFSRNANESVQVRREVERAVHHSLIIIPLRIEDIEPAASLEYFLSSPHWLDALAPPLQSHLERLADAILNFLGQSRTTTEANRGEKGLQPPLTMEAGQVVSHGEDLSDITSPHETVMNLIGRRKFAEAAGLCVDRNYLSNRLMLDSPAKAHHEAPGKARRSHASDILLLAQLWPRSLDVAPIELCVTTFAEAGWQTIANSGGYRQDYDKGKAILATCMVKSQRVV